MGELVTAALAVLGTAAMTVAVFGVVRFRDDYVRLHAASKGLVLGTAVVLACTLGTADLTLIGRALLVGAFLLVTVPVGAHALAERVHRDRQSGGARDSDQPRR